MTMFVNALDPQLPSLASNAAVELDLLLNGEPTQLTSVYDLGERLRQTLSKPAPDQPASDLLADTETETILGQAFTHAGADPKTVVSELIAWTERIAEQLSSTTTQHATYLENTQEKENLEQQRAFCLALSQYASAYLQMAFEVRPPHPFRR